MTCVTGIRALCFLLASASIHAQQIYVLDAAAPGATPFTFGAVGEIPLAQRVAVPEAGAHVLVLTAEGRVWRWEGRAQTEPWLLAEGLDNVTAVAAGTLHDAALRSDGTVWTWGANDQGQLGNGELIARLRPGAVPGLTDVTAITAGKAFTLALRADGRVWVFGSNWNDIAPGDPRKMVVEPVAVRGLSEIEAIAVFRNRGYARDRAGRIFEWGTGDGSGAAAGPREVSALEDALLAREVVRRLDRGLRSAAGTGGTWTDNAGLARGVRLSGSRIVLDAESRSFAFDGALVDAGIGWAVAVIADRSIGGSAGGSGTGPIGSAKGAFEAGRGEVFASVDPRFSSSSANLGSAQFHNLYLQPGGTVCAWGGNSNGQLGDGTAVNRSTPVTAELSGMTMVSAGWSHGVGLKGDGTVWTWGDNSSGQLGDGTTSGKPTPNAVAGLAGASAAAAGGYHSLALIGGIVWTWGNNSHGQLGTGDTQPRNSPVQVAGLSGVSAIAGGERFSVALKSDGTVVAWGLNASGQLGDGSTADRSNFVAVAGLTNVAAIAAGSDHVLARKNDGTVWAWGFNGFGQLGDGSTTNRPTPVQSGTLVAVAIGAGSYHSLASLSNGTAWAWGQNSSGQLGDGTLVAKSTPVQVSGLTGVTGVSGGAGHSVAIAGGAALFAWGGNGSGALGNGDPSGSTQPVAVSACASGVYPPVTLSSGTPRLAAARDHAFVVRTDGVVLGWGRNQAGQLGDGTMTDRNSPVTVLGVAGAKQVSSGSLHGLVVKTDGTVRSWGDNSAGQLGIGNNLSQLTSVPVPGLASMSAAAAGGFHSLALKSDGTVWAWGFNGEGQLGDGTFSQRNSPVAVPGLTGVIAVAAGERHSLALKGDGTVWAWGLNSNGQLGDHTVSTRNVPVRVLGLANVIGIAAGTRHSVALRGDGTVWTWGLNANGQLGDGTMTDRTDRVRASGLTEVVAISGGDNHSLAARANGSAWTWGLNTNGQLGDNTNSSKPVPTLTSGLGGVVAVGGGIANSVALTNGEGIWAWGSNSFGQFGSPSPGSSLVPVAGPQLPFCIYFINPTGVFIGASGETRSALVSTAQACTWVASSDVNWISVPSTPSAGTANFSYVVVPNPTTSSRTGTITVGNKTLTVIQSAGTGCSYSIDPASLFTTSISGSGQTNVITSVGCAWTAVSDVGWITVTSGASGTGSGGVNYSYEENTTLIQRVGNITIAGQMFTIVQDPAGGGSSFTPSVGAPSPTSGSGFAQTFSFTFSDPDGATDLAVLNVLINNAIDGRNACYLAYVPSSPTSGSILLVNNAGDAGGPFAGSIALPGSAVASNGQCTINASGSSAFTVGDTLTLTLNMTFTGFFAGNKILHTAARDTAGNNSGWHAKGVWNVPGASAGAVTVVSLNPARADATSLTLSAAFSDTFGFGALDVLNLLINDGIDGRNACYLAYVRGTGTLFLVNNAGEGGGPFAGAIQIPGGNGTASNSQCSINALGSSAFGSGNTLSLILNITFNGTFVGDRIVHLAARDTFGNNSGWQALGTITVQ